MNLLSLYPPTSSGTFNVTLDHFQYSAPAERLGLRFLSYSAFANSSTAPVLFYAGNEGSVELFYNATGAMFEHAAALQAHVLFVEHRYYGSSLPFGVNGSFTARGLRFLTIEQALADYSEVMTMLPTVLKCTGTRARAAGGGCDVVLFGGSYGGMLAAWHRLKYPQLSAGAIASGAPIDFYPGTGVQQLFEEAVADTYERYGAHAGCADALRAALAAAESASPSQLGQAGVRACAPLGADAAERFAFYARGALASLAMADYPYAVDFIAPLPANPVQAACAALLSVGRPASAEGLLQALNAAVLVLVNASSDLRCLDLQAELVGTAPSAPSALRSTLPRPSSPHAYASPRASPAASSRAIERPQARPRRDPVLSSAARTTSHATECHDCHRLPSLPRTAVTATHCRCHGLPPVATDCHPLPRTATLIRPPRRMQVLGTTAWNYQACTELILEPITSDGYGFYPPSESQLASTRALCAAAFEIEPRPGWMPLAFGRAAAFGSASNIVFMENDKDPWHVGTATLPPVGGVNGSVLRVLAHGGAHHQDLRSTSALDAPEVLRARALERDAMRRWLQ